MKYLCGVPRSAPEPEPHICRGGDCQWKHAARPPHQCPYDQEMAGGDTDTTCDCCSACERECSDDI